MAAQAKITSLDALESFRADLIIFLTKARRAADDVNDEVRRTRQWVQHDRRLFWQNEFRTRSRALEQAEGELFSAKLSQLHDTTATKQAAVQKAKRALVEAEEKLRKIKQWSRNYEAAVAPLSKRLESLRQYLDDDLPKGITYLVQTLRTLEGYLESTPLPKATVAAAPNVSAAPDKESSAP